MKKIAIYTRKSVFKENSESIETQIQMCKNYFRNDNCEFEVFEDEGFSGKNTNRPAFKRLMLECRLNKFEAVAVYRVDRIARNTIDFMNIYNELDKLNVKLISITESFDPSTPAGRMMMFMLAGFADMERMTIVERVKDNMLSLAKKGCWTGGTTPKGYNLTKIDGKSYLELDDKEFIQDMYNWYAEERSLYEVLRLQKAKYKNNAYANAKALSTALRSPIYVESYKSVSEYFKSKQYEIIGKENGKGYLTYGVTSGNPALIVSRHNVVISPELWLKVNFKLDKAKDDYFKKESKVYWLSGILQCPFCGSYYVLVNSGRNSYYVCGNRLRRDNKPVEKCMNNKYINANWIEKQIDKEMDKLNSSTQYFNDIYKEFKNENKTDTKDLEKSITQNESMINNLVEKLMFLSNAASKPFMNKIEELTKENEELKIKIENAKLDNLEKDINKNSKDIVKNNLKIISQIKDPREKRKLLKATFNKLVYDPFKDTLKIF
jgi:DNA invertase Pin-like site-specific DNA recombinase